MDLLPSLLATACAAALCGCGSAPTPDAGPPPDCAPGVDLEVRGRAGYERVAVAAEAELVLGFQGFKYVVARGHAGVLPGTRGGAVVFALDGESARSQPFGDLGFHADGQGAFVTDELRVFFNDDPLPELVDHGVTMHLHLDCGDSSGGHLVLRFDPGCTEGPDGQCVCLDAGVADAATIADGAAP